MENWKNGEFVGIEEVTVPEEQGEAPPTTEERITTLENALISQKIVGGGITNITDSSDNKIKDIKILGNSEQTTTIGNNLFDYERALNPENYTEGAYGYFGMEIDAEIGKKYVFERNSTNGYELGLGNLGLKTDNMGTTYFLVDNNNKQNNHSKSIITATQNKIFFVTNVRESEKLKRLLETCLKNPMLNEGEMSLPYEPYTGRKPSPSPEHQQEIYNLGKYNEETRKYDVDVKVTGKNLIPFPYPLLGGAGTTKTVKGVTVTVQDDGGIKLVGTSTEVVYFNICEIDFGESFVGDTNGTCCIQDAKYDRRWNTTFVGVENVGKTINKVFYPQIEFGTKPTEYEPYREPQIVTLSLDKPLRGTKDYKDVIRENEIVRNICEPFELDLTNAKDGGYWKTDTIMFYVNVEKKTVPFNDLKSSIACNLLPDCGGGKGNIYNVDYECLSANGNAIFFRIARNRLKDTSTPAKAKESLLEYMAGKQMIVQYAVLEPTTESFPEEFRKALEKLSTHYPTTVVTVDDGEVYGGVEVTYTADTKNYIDQQIASVVKTVVETQKALL